MKPEPDRKPDAVVMFSASQLTSALFSYIEQHALVSNGRYESWYTVSAPTGSSADGQVIIEMRLYRTAFPAPGLPFKQIGRKPRRWWWPW